MSQEEDKELNYDKEQPMVGFFALYKFSPRIYRFYLAIGILAALIAGFTMPSFNLFLPDLYDSFDPDNGVDTYGKYLKITRLIMFFKI